VTDSRPDETRERDPLPVVVQQDLTPWLWAGIVQVISGS
jgi:hypothetical protein